ncbi:hypothetical protein Ocin01_15122, partial [Orchesella cincta]
RNYFLPVKTVQLFTKRRLSTPLPKALLILLVIIGVIYCAHSGSGFETDGGCETFCASCDQGGVVNSEVENLMSECDCCVPPITGE